MRFLHNPMTKHLTDVSGIASEVTENLRVLRLRLGNAPEAEKALAGLESFVAVSLRVMAKTNPSKLRDCARAEYIKGLMDGSPEI